MPNDSRQLRMRRSRSVRTTDSALLRSSGESERHRRSGPTGDSRDVLFGEALIAEARLEPLPNPAPERDYVIEISSPEFTCLCPRSGFPDFATITIRYVPDQLIVELRSFKLYLNRYRDEHIFHEAAVNRILDDFVAACQPRWAEIVGDFNVRGNVKTIITAEHQQERRPPGR